MVIIPIFHARQSTRPRSNCTADVCSDIEELKSDYAIDRETIRSLSDSVVQIAGIVQQLYKDFDKICLNEKGKTSPITPVKLA